MKIMIMIMNFAIKNQFERVYIIYYRSYKQFLLIIYLNKRN